MKQQELIKQCRYYNAEKVCPFDNGENEWFWDMERVYVRSGGNFEGETEYYKRIKGKIFAEIPFPLLMVMFTSWAKWTTDIAGQLDEFYRIVNKYLLGLNDRNSDDGISNQ